MPNVSPKGESLGRWLTLKKQGRLDATDYVKGISPRAKVWAAESHARLGLIYDLSGYIRESNSEYDTAASLLSDYPERKAQYHQRADSLKQTLSTLTP